MGGRPLDLGVAFWFELLGAVKIKMVMFSFASEVEMWPSTQLTWVITMSMPRLTHNTLNFEHEI